MGLGSSAVSIDGFCSRLIDSRLIDIELSTHTLLSPIEKLTLKAQIFFFGSRPAHARVRHALCPWRAHARATPREAGGQRKAASYEARGREREHVVEQARQRGTHAGLYWSSGQGGSLHVVAT